MDYEKLIRRLRNDADAYRNGKTLGRAFADQEDVLDNASYFGRIFARSGGLTDAVKQALKEQGSDFIVNPIPCDGIEACRVALLKKQKNLLKENFIEGMACVGGCIGGAACVTHGPKDKTEVNKYGQLAKEKTILDAIAVTQIAK